MNNLSSVPKTEGLQFYVVVFMPFKAEFNGVWLGAVEPAIREHGLSATRADECHRCNAILENIKECVRNPSCQGAIVDITGFNPNVMFELGLVVDCLHWGQGKPVIVIAQTANKLPIDIRHINVIRYSNTLNGLDELRRRLEKYLHEMPLSIAA